MKYFNLPCPSCGEPLKEGDVLIAMERALCDSERGFGSKNVVLDADGARDHVAYGRVLCLLVCKFAKIDQIAEYNQAKVLKAMQDNDLDIAIDEFKSAIKNYKKNYLGYMGICNILTRMDKKNLKKIKYYKKKCIKYAPKELKDNIVRRYE